MDARQIAVERLIVAFRIARSLEFRHFCEQGGLQGLSTEARLEAQRGFRAETEALLEAVFGPTLAARHGPD